MIRSSTGPSRCMQLETRMFPQSLIVPRGFDACQVSLSPGMSRLILERPPRSRGLLQDLRPLDSPVVFGVPMEARISPQTGCATELRSNAQPTLVSR